MKKKYSKPEHIEVTFTGTKTVDAKHVLKKNFDKTFASLDALKRSRGRLR